MKLTFVTATLTSGGSERVMSIVANKMQERGYEVEIICLNDQIVFYPINDGIKITHVEVESGTNLCLRNSGGLGNTSKRRNPT